MPVLMGGMVEGAIIGGAAGLLVGVFAALFGPKRRCPECDEKLPTPWVKPLTSCPHCGCDLPDARRKKKKK